MRPLITRALLASALSLDRAIELAMAKDGGLTPALLGWAVSQFPLADDERVPGEIDVDELQEFRVELQQRLARLARPR